MNRDSFFLIEVSWHGGFKHWVPCRGYNLESQLKFSRKLDYVDSVIVNEVTEETYHKYHRGEEPWVTSPVVKPPVKEKVNGRTKQRKAQQENPPKASRGKTKSEDSKTVRNPSTKRTRTTGSQPSELRKPKVRNVRKPKKNI